MRPGECRPRRQGATAPPCDSTRLSTEKQTIVLPAGPAVDRLRLQQLHVEVHAEARAVGEMELVAPEVQFVIQERVVIAVVGDVLSAACRRQQLLK